MNSAGRAERVADTDVVSGAEEVGSAGGSECAGRTKDIADVVVGGFLIRVIP